MVIDTYTFGAITIDGKAYDADVIVFPDRVYDHWWRKEGHSLCLEDLEEVLKQKPEVLIIGRGADGCMQVPDEVKKQLENRGINVIVEKTAAAVKEYNKLHPGKNAIAALHLTC